MIERKTIFVNFKHLFPRSRYFLFKINNENTRTMEASDLETPEQYVKSVQS